MLYGLQPSRRAQVNIPKHGQSNIGLVEPYPAKVRPVEVRPAEVRPSEICFSEVC
jgi:hypothetical protein